MPRLFSRHSNRKVPSDMSSTTSSAPPQTVTVEQLQGEEFQQELPPPPVKPTTPPRKSTADAAVGVEANSPGRSSASGSTAAESEVSDDFGLSCTGLLGEEVLLDTGFGRMSRSAIEALSDWFRMLSSTLAEPIHKTTKAAPPQDEVIISDLDAIMKENEKLKKENTWLQEENASLRGGYEEEQEEENTQRTGKSV